MATTDILSTLQTLNASITGITQAPTDFPAQLNGAELPMALSYPERADYNRFAVGGYTEDRIWYVRLYVMPISQGRSVDEGFGRTVPFVDLFRDAYETLANQDRNDWWSEMQLVSDSGVRADMRLHNSPEAPPHWGVEFEVRVLVHYDQ